MDRITAIFLDGEKKVYTCPTSGQSQIGYHIYLREDLSEAIVVHPKNLKMLMIEKDIKGGQ